MGRPVLMNPDIMSTCITPTPPGERFLKGVAISVWQNAPCQTSQWTNFAKRFTLEAATRRLLHGWSKDHPDYNLDISPDFWNRCDAVGGLLCGECGW